MVIVGAVVYSKIVDYHIFIGANAINNCHSLSICFDDLKFNFAEADLYPIFVKIYPMLLIIAGIVLFFVSGFGFYATHKENATYLLLVRAQVKNLLWFELKFPFFFSLSSLQLVFLFLSLPQFGQLLWKSIIWRRMWTKNFGLCLGMWSMIRHISSFGGYFNRNCNAAAFLVGRNDSNLLRHLSSPY